MYNELIKLKDLRENLDKYLSRLDKTGGFTVVRRSSPIFNISPVDAATDNDLWESVVDFTRIKKGGVNVNDILSRL